MSGHSKFANIKHKKERNDAAKGKIFTILGREIAVAVKEGGPDPSNNFKLAQVIAKAKANNMPNDTIDRGIKKAAGDMGNVNYEYVTYEGYGPNGIAMIVDVVTDNRNRTAAEVRHLFDKSGGSMGASGCVAWMFDKRGVIVIERTSDIDEDEIMMQALEAGAEDVVPQDDVFEIYTNANDFSAVREELEKLGYGFLSAEVSMIPQTTVDASDPELAEKIERMIERFDDNDDVQQIYHNAILPEVEEEE